MFSPADLLMTYVSKSTSANLHQPIRRTENGASTTPSSGSLVELMSILTHHTNQTSRIITELYRILLLVHCYTQKICFHILLQFQFYEYLSVFFNPLVVSNFQLMFWFYSSLMSLIKLMPIIFEDQCSIGSFWQHFSKQYSNVQIRMLQCHPVVAVIIAADLTVQYKFGHFQL